MKWEKVTIFISSTFNDMHAERDYLIKDIFPELREWCEERKIHLVDVDLRWGVTEADSSAKNTVLACLHNIDESRPFFLCFLGQRRGWVPSGKDINKETTKLYPAVEDIIGKYSVTEMEIEHALLSPMRHLVDGQEKSEIPVNHALFYFRKDTYRDQLTPEQRKIFTNEGEDDKATADTELKNYITKIKSQWTNTIDYDCQWDKNILSPELITSAFKNNESEGRLSQFEVNGKPLKDLIVSQLKKEILDEFPDRRNVEASTDLEKDLDQQDLFIGLNSEGFIARKGDFDALNGYLKNDKDGLFVLTAPAGYGKSMLLANFVIRESAKYSARFFNRFCGASDLSSQTFSLWKSIFDEAGIACPNNLNDLQNEIKDLLKKLAEKQTFIIIDAINQLPDGLDMLNWLPEELPANLKIILSMKEDEADETVSALIERLQNNPQVTLSSVNPLENKEEKQKLIHEYLRKYLKSLDDAQIEAICSFKGSANPLYLKILLSELRVFGSFEQLGAQIQKFGVTPKQAFDAVLERLEKDINSLGIDSKAFATALFGLLANARTGLSEAELTPCLQAELPQIEEGKLTQAIRLFVRQVRPFMARREGRTDYFYESFKLAAKERYANHAIRHNQLLSDYFQKQADPAGNLSFTGQCARDFNELPYHLYQAQAIETLEKNLGEYLWIRSKLNLTHVDNTAQDYVDYIERDRNHYLKLIGECLVLSAHILGANKDQLPSHLWGRMIGIKDEKIQKLLEQAKDVTKEPWLRPMYQCMDEPGGAQIRILKGQVNYHYWPNKYDLWSYCVNDVCYSPDGKMIATTDDHNCILWDPNTGKRIRTLEGHKDHVGTICFSPDGKLLASGSFDTTCIIWNTNTGEKIKTLTWPGKGKIEMDTWEKRTGAVLKICFSPDGKILATAYRQDRCVLWNTDIWQPKPNSGYKACFDSITCLCFSPDGKMLASSSMNKMEYTLWDINTEESLRRIGHNNGAIFWLCFSPDGKIIVTVSRDKSCILWDVNTGEKIITLKGHSNWVKCVCFSPDGKMLATASEDKFCILWDATTGEKITKLDGHPESVESLCFSPDGKILASISKDGSCILWHVTVQKEKITPLNKHQDYVTSVCFSPDGKMIASAAYDKTCILWNTNTGKRIKTLEGHNRSVEGISFSSDGKMIASIGWHRDCILWDTHEGTKIKTINSPILVSSTCFVTNGRLFISEVNWEDNHMYLLDANTGEKIATFKNKLALGEYDSPRYLEGIYISSNSEKIATLRDDNTCHLFETKSMKGITTFDAWGGSRFGGVGVNSLSFSPDGKILAFPSENGTCSLMNTDTGKIITTLEGHTHTAEINSLCFSKNGKILASVSTGVCILWNMATNTIISTFKTDDNLRGIDFSSDNSCIIFGSSKGSVYLCLLENMLYKNKKTDLFSSLVGRGKEPINKLNYESIDEDPVLDDNFGAETLNSLIDFEYKIAGNKIILTKYTGSDTNVVIPSRNDNGFPVVGLEGTFRNCEWLTSVTIPDGIVDIGQCAFESCKALTSVNIPKSVTNIGKGAFNECLSLESIIIPNSVTCIENETFKKCTALTSIVIPYGITSINDEVFLGCSSLTEIIIPESVTSIGNNAFTDTGITFTIAIPDSVTSIADNAFDCHRGTRTSLVIRCRCTRDSFVLNYARNRGKAKYFNPDVWSDPSQTVTNKGQK
jgi:WD40 repeat protein/Ni,Fe-hydrogenase maturation factor